MGMYSFFMCQVSDYAVECFYDYFFFLVRLFRIPHRVSDSSQSCGAVHNLLFDTSTTVVLLDGPAVLSKG